MNFDILKYIFVGVFVLFIILFFVFLLLFKPKKLISYTAFLLAKIPDFIKIAEDLGFTSGEMKKNYVINLCFQYLVSLSGEKVENLYSKYSGLIDTYIEDILSTPQKKDNRKE